MDPKTRPRDRPRRRRIALRVPAPLAWLLVAVALLGLTWALLVPAWQAPDENSHFAYVQSLGERFDATRRRRPADILDRAVDWRSAP